MRPARSTGLPPALPVLRARLVPECAAELRGRKIVAFAGIGRPEKFFASVRALDGNLVAAHAFPDHHVYRASDSARLLGEAEAQGAQLVTTAKDYVKLPETLRAASSVVTVRLHWDDEAALQRLLA